jgi:hypothetical protein
VAPDPLPLVTEGRARVGAAGVRRAHVERQWQSTDGAVVGVGTVGRQWFVCHSRCVPAWVFAQERAMADLADRGWSAVSGARSARTRPCSVTSSGCTWRARRKPAATTPRCSCCDWLAPTNRSQRWLCSRVSAPDVPEFRHRRDLTDVDVREFGRQLDSAPTPAVRPGLTHAL